MQMSAINDTEISKVASMTAEQVTKNFARAIITGYRYQNKWRGAVEAANGNTPFAVMIAECHAVILNRRRANAACEEWTGIKTDTESLYRAIAMRMREHTQNSLKKAGNEEKRLKILNPGMYLGMG